MEVPSEQIQSRERDAHQYAWSWFSYHADQRLKSFNLFFLLEAALTAGYLTAFSSGQRLLASGVGFLLLVAAIMFWRLDARNSLLVKIAERYLKDSEKKMSDTVGNNIKLVAEADSSNGEFNMMLLPGKLDSYKTIFSAVFCSVVIFSLFAILYPLFVSDVGEKLQTTASEISSASPNTKE